MKKRLLILAGVGAVTCAAVLLDPTCVLLGLLRNESFYRGRPTTYWGRALRDEDPTVQVETRKVLKEGGAAAVPVLVELLREGRGSGSAAAEERWTAATLLGQIGPEARAAVPALIEALKDPDPHVRSVAVSALSEVDPKARDAIPALVELLKTDEPMRAIQALARFGPEAREAVPVLTGLLKDRAADVRWNAARTL